VNRPVIHTSVHVPVDDKQPGLSLFIFGQYFNRNESWAELAKPWVDYIARSSLLLQQGRNVADVAYFHGEEAPPLTHQNHPKAYLPRNRRVRPAGSCPGGFRLHNVGHRAVGE
jgi:hypothetical protein